MQTGVVIAIYWTTHRYLFEGSEDPWRLLPESSGPVAIAGCMFVVLRHPALAVSEDTPGVIVQGLVRVTIVSVVWAAVGRAVLGQLQRRSHQLVEADL